MAYSMFCERSILARRFGIESQQRRNPESYRGHGQPSSTRFSKRFEQTLFKPNPKCSLSYDKYSLLEASMRSPLTRLSRYTPRWILPQSRVTKSHSVSYIIPDAVFHVPLNNTLVQPIYQLHLDVARLAHYIIWLPILIVEYVKSSVDVDEGRVKHYLHLMMCMVAAAKLYEVLGMPLHIPLFGLLVERWKVHLVCAWRTSTSELRYKITASYDLSLPLQCYWLRLLISDLPEHGRTVATIAREQVVRLTREEESADYEQAAASREEVPPQMSQNNDAYSGVNEWRISLPNEVEVL